jgi:polysaccharide export outer membrane protein
LALGLLACAGCRSALSDPKGAANPWSEMADGPAAGRERALGPQAAAVSPVAYSANPNDPRYAGQPFTLGAIPPRGDRSTTPSAANGNGLSHSNGYPPNGATQPSSRPFNPALSGIGQYPSRSAPAQAGAGQASPGQYGPGQYGPASARGAQGAVANPPVAHARAVQTAQYVPPSEAMSANASPLPPNPTGLENRALYPRRTMLNSPGEGRMYSLPTYTIAPPDVLLIDAVKVVPKSPYQVEPFDQLDIKVAGTLPDQPITGTFAVEPSGTVNLGPTYGRVPINGLTLEEATHAIDQHLRRLLKEPEVSVSLLASAGQQLISGEHLVSLDGMVNLGTYGSVYVSGLTLAQARVAIERQLAKFLESPKVSVDVYAYNSKVYYIISAGAGAGDSVTRFPITGNDTVLDALAQVNGLTRANNKKIWIARPAQGEMACDQILPVCWNDIAKGGSTATNYQLLPGDRLYLEEDHWIAADSTLGKIIAPFERVLGFTLLGAQTIQNLQTFPGGPTNTNR